MKLQQLQEDTQYPNVELLLKLGKSIDPRFTLTNLSWIAAALDVEYISESDWENVVGLVYYPTSADEAFKNNAKRVEEDMNDRLEEFDDIPMPRRNAKIKEQLAEWINQYHAMSEH